MRSLSFIVDMYCYLASSEADEEEKPPVCSWYLSIREGGSTVMELNLCISDERQLEIYSSHGTQVEIFIKHSTGLDTLPSFLLQYKRKLSALDVQYPSRHGPDFHRPQSQITIDSPDFHLRRSQNCLLGYTNRYKGYIFSCNCN